MPSVPPSRSSVDELCAKYDTEKAHAGHVAALALQLFDATSAELGVPADDRPLLEAACRLHEVGFRTTPRRHAHAGFEIVRREGLRGFSDDARGDIAAAIFLHPLQLGAADRRFARRLHASPRGRRLAAYLRVADGLDAAHLQDAAIVSVRPDGRVIRLHVACHDLSPGPGVADRKADLWREVLSTDLQIVRNGRKAGPLLTESLPVIEAARRLLQLEFHGLAANARAARVAADRAALHATRVRARRIRAVLRIFRRPLKASSAARVKGDLGKLSAALGEIRDLDVWIDLLTGRALRPQLAANPRGRRFVDHQVELRRLHQATVKRHLGGASFLALQARVGRLLRIEMPRLLETAPGDSLGDLARRALDRSLRDALELADLRHARSLAKQHRLRRALRRLRLAAEFVGWMFGPEFTELGRRAHAVERSLGRLRDSALALERVSREGPPPPRIVARSLDCRREAAVAELRSAWRRFTQPRLLDQVRRCIQRSHLRRGRGP